MLHKYLSVDFSNTWKGFTEKKGIAFSKKQTVFNKKRQKDTQLLTMI